MVVRWLIIITLLHKELLALWLSSVRPKKLSIIYYGRPSPHQWSYCTRVVWAISSVQATVNRGPELYRYRFYWKFSVWYTLIVNKSLIFLLLNSSFTSNPFIIKTYILRTMDVSELKLATNSAVLAVSQYQPIPNLFNILRYEHKQKNHVCIYYEINTYEKLNQLLENTAAISGSLYIYIEHAFDIIHNVRYKSTAKEIFQLCREVSRRRNWSLFIRTLSINNCQRIIILGTFAMSPCVCWKSAQI